MPAELTTTNGKTEMFYTGETPWHGLGQALDEPATAKEAIQAAGLDWAVETVPVFVNKGGLARIPDKMAIQRQDTKLVFNVMSNKYTPIQNMEAFNFFDGVVGAGEAIYHTAGSLFDGRKVWILAKLPGTLEITKKDVLEKYILLTNSHDGTKAFTMAFTPIRVVCNNTLSVALGSLSGSTFKARHLPNVLNRVNEARELLGLAEAYFANLMEGVNRLVEKKFSESDMVTMVGEIYKLDPKKVMADQHFLVRHSAEATLSLYRGGQGTDLSHVKGTAWAAFNAVTEYVDHHRPIGVQQKTEGVAVREKRLDYSWYGRNADLRQKTWDYLARFSAN